MVAHSHHNKPLDQFSQRHQLVGLSYPTLNALLHGEYQVEQGHAFLQFQQRINNELLQHPVIKRNSYCQWFSQGEVDLQQLQYFIIQFSVFSNQFLIAQLYKMLAADTLENMHSSKEILANELGVVFCQTAQTTAEQQPISLNQSEQSFGAISGSIEGGRFRFQSAHFELLLKTAEPLGLTFGQLGKRKQANAETLFFCDELVRLYGSEDYQSAAAASYAVENWANAGFWAQLISGLNIFKRKHNMPQLPITFFSWHDKLEASHAQHTQSELEQYFFNKPVDCDRFISEAYEMLDGVHTFWLGLEQARKTPRGRALH